MLFPARILKPHTLAMLTRVCRTICAENGFPPDSPAAEKIASHLLLLYMNGLTDPRELIEAERNRGTLRSATQSPSLYQSEMTQG